MLQIFVLKKKQHINFVYYEYLIHKYISYFNYFPM